MPSLPLFPLGGVLLPGARMPLQLFEPRYLELAQHLAALPEPERRFGIVLIRHGHEVGGGANDLHGVGCEAAVDAMALADGAAGTVVHLVGRGERRFRVERVDEQAGTSWTTGVVTWLDEPEQSEDPEVAGLTTQVLRAHERYLATLGATADPVEAGPREIAYRVCERMVLDVADRQRVLEGADPESRLRLVLSILKRETAIVGKFRALPTPPDLGGAALN